MIEFIAQIADLLSSFLGFIITAIQMIIAVFVAAFRAITYIGALILALPPFVLVFVSVSIAVSVILFIVNHGSE